MHQARSGADCRCCGRRGAEPEPTPEPEPEPAAEAPVAAIEETTEDVTVAAVGEVKTEETESVASEEPVEQVARPLRAKATLSRISTQNVDEPTEENVETTQADMPAEVIKAPETVEDTATAALPEDTETTVTTALAEQVDAVKRFLKAQQSRSQQQLKPQQKRLRKRPPLWH